MARVLLENSINAQDTAIVTESFSILIVVAATILTVAIAILIYFKKHKH